MSHEDPYCDHTIATGSTLAELSRESGFADFVSAYAQGRESSITTTASGAPLTFPSDATVGATFDSVDPALRQKFRANILDLLEDSRCQWSKKQLESVVDSELDAPYASTFGPDHDLQQLGMNSRYKLPLPTEDNLPGRGALITDKYSNVGMFQIFQQKCGRFSCKSRRFQEGQKPVHYKRGMWSHAHPGPTKVSLEPLAAYTRSCTSCQTLFETGDNIMTSLKAKSAAHMLFDRKGQAYTCRNADEEAAEIASTGERSDADVADGSVDSMD